ncbi:MAG: hypothetical protein WCL49_02855 [bacterium]
MSDDIKPENGSIPPRVTIKIPGQSGELAETPTAATMPTNKAKTARISLDQVTAEPGATQAAPVSGVGVASKTIRLAPAMTGQVLISSMPSVGKAVSGMVSEESKSQTSRISLEAVMAEISGNSQELPPKTIKVKRPVLTNVPKVTSLPAEVQSESPAPAMVAPQQPAGELVSKSQTARVDIVPEAAEPQQTQKKTIKIRRADGATGDFKPASRSVSIARAEGESAEAPKAGSDVPAPHGIFIAMAAAAALVLCFMLYVLAAQANPALGWPVGI